MRTIICGFVIAAVWLAGCAAEDAHYDMAPIADREAPIGKRIASINGAWAAVERGEASPEGMREQLKRAIWSRTTASRVRIAAINALLEDEPNLADTENMFRLMLPTETDFDVIAKVGDESARRGWVSVAPALVRSWSRIASDPPDEKRPEKRALAELFPGRAPEEVVFDVFAGRIVGTELRDRERIAAWGLLQRVDTDGERAKVLLASTAPASDDSEPDRLVDDLRWCAVTLGCVPHTGEQLEWLRGLKGDAHKPFIAECESAYASLGEEQRRGFELRHLAGIRWASKHRTAWLAAGRETLLNELRGDLGRRKHHLRPGSVNTNEMLRTWEGRLAWGDVLLMLIACEARDDAAVAGALFGGAEQDRADNSTEHGGVIDADDSGRFKVLAFAPRATQRRGDQQFSASEDMLKAGDAALFHFHYHVQQYRNGDFAGPSQKDLEYATQFGRMCFVFTFINEHTLNMDCYLPGNAVVDLGEVTRTGETPSAGK